MSMKYLFLALALMSCSQKLTNTTQKGDSDLMRYTDEENNVTCYRVRGFEGVSCLQLAP